MIRPESWWAAGGMDENFTGWGGEDEAFSYLFAAAGGVTGHGQLPAVKTQHEQARWGTPEHQTAVRRELVTKHIWKNPHLLTEWLEVRDRPGVVDEWTTKYLSTLR